MSSAEAKELFEQAKAVSGLAFNTARSRRIAVPEDVADSLCSWVERALRDYLIALAAEGAKIRESQIMQMVPA